MFTGIVETTGKVLDVVENDATRELYVSAPFLDELKVDQSIAHNGVCLTVTKTDKDGYRVQVVEETLKKTNLGLISPGDIINLERSVRVGDRLDGHIVQAHVDCTGTCEEIRKKGENLWYKFSYPESYAQLIIAQGSITVNGVSLTVSEENSCEFIVTIIPYTYNYTNFSTVKEGDTVNLEFDILGKYIRKILLK